MKITNDNKSTFFLQKEAVKQYAEGRSKIAEIFGKEFIKFLKERNFQKGKILNMGLFLSPFSVTYPFKTFRSAFDNSILKNCSLKKGLFWIDIRSNN